eukprot:1142912-Pelagomonas_calceolata.AAC.23
MHDTMTMNSNFWCMLLPPTTTASACTQEFLRTRGVCLQSSVIRQATVTQLADTNSPQDIAAVLAGASGLARYSFEAWFKQGEGFPAARLQLRACHEEECSIS